MPKDHLPGFYFDAEKNRYFPYKGPIPGSSRKPPSKPPPSDPKQAENLCQCVKLRQHRLLQERELCGNAIFSPQGRLNFQAQYQNRHASQPTIWKYKGTEKMANIALVHVVADVMSPQGLMERDVLVSCGMNGLLCHFLVGNAGQDIDAELNYKLDPVWPPNMEQLPRHKMLSRRLGNSGEAMTYLTSDVSCIKVLTKHSLSTDTNMSKDFLITTLGSDSALGSVYILDFSELLDFRIRPALYELAAFEQTIWSADCGIEGRHAVIGTNKGAMILDIETRISSSVFLCKSDVLSLQLDQSRNFILCGLRNGTIVTVDTRQKQMRRNVPSSSKVSMSSSVCCLASLKLWDQYFLASSMDGSIKLYDHRLLQRGPVQSYEGNVNSHTRIELGIDPSENVVMSGGEDCYLRLWNIKSGELLFKERFMNSISTAVCWPRIGGNRGLVESTKCGQDYRNYWQDHSLGAWIGSYDGIFYMDWL